MATPRLLPRLIPWFADFYECLNFRLLGRVVSINNSNATIDCSIDPGKAQDDDFQVIQLSSDHHPPEGHACEFICMRQPENQGIVICLEFIDWGEATRVNFRAWKTLVYVQFDHPVLFLPSDDQSQPGNLISYHDDPPTELE